MSIYDTIHKISLVASLKHSITPQKVIARFHTDEKVIQYYFSDYDPDIFARHMSFDYDRVEVSYQFWNPKLCRADMLMLEDLQYFETLDIFNSEVSWNAAAGFVLSLIGIYNIILQSYKSTKFEEILQSVDFDKQIMCNVFRHIDIVVSMPDGLLQFVKNLFADNILDIMITPSGYFRFTIDDIAIVSAGSNNVHEISKLIDTHVEDDLTKLYYYIEVLRECGEIQSLSRVNDLSNENIMLAICKLSIDIDRHFKLLERAVLLYYDRGGTLVTMNIPSIQRYPNFDVILQTFKSLYPGSSRDIF